MIVAFSAGGGTDIAARTLVPFIEEHLGDGASIVVVNRPGAGGEVGFTELAQAAPDGYTIGFINTPNLVSIPIERSARYSLDDIQPVANVIYDPAAFSVLPGSEIQSLDDLVAYATENPGQVTHGTTGLGSDDHLAALEFERLAGVTLRHIPFSGQADVRAAALGGHVMIANMNISEAIVDITEGNLHGLGQMAETRWDDASDVPTFKEQGYDIVAGSHRGIGVPAGVPEEVLAKLEAAVQAAIEDPEFQERAGQQMLALEFMDAEAFEATLRDQHETFSALWAENPWVQQ
jgi:tripartite-type tricarboxylate transporter receptor subunit TctC